MKKRIVTFGAQEVEVLATRCMLQGSGATMRHWIEALITRLCAPGLHHPTLKVENTLGACRLTHPESRQSTVQFSWSLSAIHAVDPGLKAAEMTLHDFLTLLWYWSYSDGQLHSSLAARLAAFVDGMRNQRERSQAARGWRELHALAPAGKCSPYDLVTPAAIDPSKLPWL